MFTALELFGLAVQVEVNGERFYRYALDRVERASLKEMLGWLADEEARHREAFSAILEKHRAKKKPRAIPVLNDSLLRSAMGRHAFSLDELRLESIKDEDELIRAAIVFEEDSIQFFEFISSFVSDPRALSIIEEIRTEESNHIRLLSEKISK